MPSKFEKLSMPELKSRLVQAVKVTKATMAPMLYYLRKRIKAQGKSGQGFGQWVEEHLEIHRRTADRWADEWAVAEGLKKAPKKTVKTFRHLSKGVTSNSNGRVTVPLSFVLVQKEADEFIAAMNILGDKATVVIYDAVIKAAQSHKKPVQAASRLTFPPDKAPVGVRQ